MERRSKQDGLDEQRPCTAWMAAPGRRAAASIPCIHGFRKFPEGFHGPMWSAQIPAKNPAVTKGVTQSGKAGRSR